MPAIPELRGALFNINPGAKTGDCTQCAVEAAKVLTKGRAARPATASRSIEDDKYASKKVREFVADDGRANTVRIWLFSAGTATGVYAVDAGEDHAYNFVKTTLGRLYVVDSNLQVYLRINPTEPDFRVTIDDERYNYADPADDDGGPMTVYYWGPLEPRWNDKLNVDD